MLALGQRRAMAMGEGEGGRQSGGLVGVESRWTMLNADANVNVNWM